MNLERFSLAELVDWLALPAGPRDRLLVRRIVAWCQDQGGHLRLEAMELSAWQGVVLTLRVDQDVSLVVTGSRADQPGQWTWQVPSRQFPEVWLRVWPEALQEPYSFCALDYARTGQAVLLPTGDTGTVVVQAMIGGVEEVRVRTAQGKNASWPAADVTWPGET